MFSNLLASAPKRAALSPSAWGVSSVLHVLALSAVAWGTSLATEAPATSAPVIYVSLTDAPEPLDEPEQPPPAEQPAGPEAAPVEIVRTDVPEGFQELSAPDEILASIPPPSSVEIRAEDFSGMGVAGGVARGRPILAAAPDTARPVQPAPLSVAVVDEAPRVLNREQIAVRMRDLYPLRYRMADIEGQVVVQLVVGTDGRVEEDGLSVVSSTYPEFEGPSRELVQELRWEPARRNGQPVRVWVRLPVSWTID